MIVFYVLIFLIILTIIVAIHELGHFLAAKKFGVLCREYAIGMGPKLWSKKYGETLYSIRAIPVGGFVQMAGEDEADFELNIGDVISISLDDNQKINGIYSENSLNNSADRIIQKLTLRSYDLNSNEMFLEGMLESDSESKKYALADDASIYEGKDEMQIAPVNRRFWSLAPLKKIVVLVAGPFMNVVLAIVAFIAMGLFFGNPEPTPVVGDVTEGSVAQSSGIQSGDIFISINGKSVSTFAEASERIKTSPGTELTLVIQRNDELIPINITPSSVTQEVQNSDGTVTKVVVGQLGILQSKSYNPIIAITSGFTRAVDMTGQVFTSLGMLISGSAGINQLSGPIGIAAMTGTIVESSGFSGVLFFLGFLSINIGLLNLLPFPALDGGRIVFAIYELITRKRPNRKFEMGLNLAGFVLLMGLFVYIAFNDIIRLIY
ncbi:RIP metalloprotease RseP [Culicoidibacter larvae]|uniref:Zinc metalloprotease n=1 Tax=Culicoidibacter larvae TaxID=2579976 RepID=A0A5R8QFJ3_9FIRM|nr:RIP metalloprotease RseP [Culicoidibacter larvae]TLG76506.1 RIP metalloprotease RseP [Culicoidibacter larvae]